MQLVKDRQFYRQILSLALPIFLQQLLRISVNTIDSLMLGSIDQVQMSAISQANQIFFIYYTICSGLSVGCSVLVSQFWGKKDTDSIPYIIAQALRLTVIIGTAVSLLVHFFPEAFMRIYSSDAGIIEVGAAYLKKVSLMYLVCGISVVLFGASRGVEQVRIILFTNVLSYSVNIALDYVLVLGKLGFQPMGVEGVVIGTLIARYVEFLVCSWLFLSTPEIPFRLRQLKLSDSRINKALMTVTAPIVAHEVIWSLGTSSGSMITGQLGKDVVAGYNITTVLYDLCATTANGLSSACSVTLGMTLGRGDKVEAKSQAQTMLVIAECLGITLGLVTFTVRDFFIGLYSLTPEAVTYARQFMTIISCIWPFSILEIIGMIAILRAGGQGKIGFYTDIVVMWMICIPLAAYLAFVAHAEPWLIVLTIKFIIVLESIIGIINVCKYRWLNNLTEV